MNRMGLYVVFVALAASVGCESHFDMRRVDVDGIAQLEVGREMRPALPRLRVQTLVLDQGRPSGCSARIGIAALEPGAVPVFRIDYADAAGASHTLYRGSPETTQVWQDAEFAVPGSGALQLELSVEGPSAAGGVWSRPLLVCPAGRRDQVRQNVLLISLDTLRADRLGVYGNGDGLTPRLDRLAAEGTLFERAYAPYPNTAASHMSLFTGYHPSQHGLTPFSRVGPLTDVVRLAQEFARNGYATAAFTEDGFVNGAMGFAIGFDLYDNGPVDKLRSMSKAGARPTFDRALAWLEGRPRAPFFLFLQTYAVHSPYTPPSWALERVMADKGEGYRGAFATEYSGLAGIAHNNGTKRMSDAELRQIERLYDAEAIALDHDVGALLDRLDALGLARDTLVVVFSDHGEQFGEHGFVGHTNAVEVEEVHVPILLRLPGVVPAGRRIAEPTALLDLGPTLAEIAGIGEVLSGSPSRSVSGAILGRREWERRPVFSEVHPNIGACERKGKRTVAADCVPDVSVRDAQYTYIDEKLAGRRRLYDLSNDPAEQHDVSAARPETTDRYRRIVENFREDVEESRLGVVPIADDPEIEQRLRALGYVE